MFDARIVTPDPRMTLEAAVNRLADSLDQLVVLLRTTQNAKSAEKPQKVGAKAPKTVDYNAVRAAILLAVNQHGHMPVLDLLEKFGAKKGSDLDPAQYAKFMAELPTLGGKV